MSKKDIREWQKDLPRPIVINIEGLKRTFSRMYINELSENIFDLISKLDDKQLFALKAMAKTFTPKNTSAANHLMKQPLIDLANLILRQRSAERKNKHVFR